MSISHLPDRLNAVVRLTRPHLTHTEGRLLQSIASLPRLCLHQHPSETARCRHIRASTRLRRRTQVRLRCTKTQAPIPLKTPPHTHDHRPPPNRAVQSTPDLITRSLDLQSTSPMSALLYPWVETRHTGRHQNTLALSALPHSANPRHQ